MNGFQIWVKENYNLELSELSDDDEYCLSEMYAGQMTEKATEMYYEER